MHCGLKFAMPTSRMVKNKAVDDAQAQQEGAPTAVEPAGDGSRDRDAAIERARTALAAGDEEAGREALVEAAAL